MNYQEALDKVKELTTKMYADFVYRVATKGSMVLLESEIGENLETLQQLIDERIEEESRKEFLKVGSEWECVVRCNGMSFSHVEGTIVKIKYLNYDAEVLTTPLTELENYLDPWGEYVDIDEVFATSQFLLCFRPVKEGDKDEKI